MQKLNLTISLEKYDNENELTPNEQQLLKEARKATYKSYAPYSKFHVGVAVLLAGWNASPSILSLSISSSLTLIPFG